jgi:hypothetical protein
MLMHTNWLNLTDEAFRERVKILALGFACRAAHRRGHRCPDAWAEWHWEKFVDRALDFAALSTAVAEAGETARNN